MKIYFGFTVAGDRSSIEAARRIVHWLEQMGHEVLTRHLVSDSAWEADRSIGPQAVYRRDMAWLEQCSLFIAEVSGILLRFGVRGRLSVGCLQQESRLALSQGGKRKISLLITGNTHADSTLVPYDHVEQVKPIIRDILK